MEFFRRYPRPRDIVIDIHFCGVCHTDFHIAYNDWKISNYPVIPGHEITGIVSMIGDNVKKFKVGDKVGVVCIFSVCTKCDECMNGNPQYCVNGMVEVFNMKDRTSEQEIKPSGNITYGGFSTVITINEDYVIKFPDTCDLIKVSTLLCSGITIYNPLLYGAELGCKKIAIVGIGGLGNIGIKIAQSI